MQLDSMSVVLRPRTTWEGCDLGVRLLQSQLPWVFACHIAVVLPWLAACLATFDIAPWLPALLMWMSKPWLDRTILFALSRALFRERTTPRDIWDAQRIVLWEQLAATFSLRRLSGSRAFTQPVHQLEGLSGPQLRARLRQLVPKHRGVARLMTQAFTAAEMAVFASLFSLQAWLAPHHLPFSWSAFSLGENGEQLFAILAYAAAITFVEPFYVAAGFGMYLNRRVELEAWDIEQEFRRAFAS
jgi:hypothetical protein